jgi:hypothetical protein
MFNRRNLIAMTVVILGLIMFLPVGQAQQIPTQIKQTVSKKETPASSNSPKIDIKIETFRKQIVPGTFLGVVADITNNSSDSVYLREIDVQLLLPPEADRPDVGINSTDGWFPTERLEAEPHVICLKPNETYRIFWGQDPNRTINTGDSSKQVGEKKSGKLSFVGRTWWWFQRYVQFIGFTPGAYPITVEAKYWDQRQFEGCDYHTAVATKAVEYVAPQKIIILGAILGGLIFTILAAVRAKENVINGRPTMPWHIAKTFGKVNLIVVGSILLSVIITILMSRVSETQFFIKVTVSDFWGAIAVGFLANYGGWALLDKMVPGKSKEGETTKKSRIKAESATTKTTDGDATNSVAGGHVTQASDATKSTAPGIE